MGYIHSFSENFQFEGKDKTQLKTIFDDQLNIFLADGFCSGSRVRNIVALLLPPDPKKR